MVFYVLAILSLAFLIVVHEGGHYFVARWCKMRIDRFSLGFGPGVLKHTSKKTGTVFQLAPIPFGGFVEIRGMNIAEEVDPDDRFAYPNRPAWQRFLTIFAGPATNYLSAFVLALALFTFHGVSSDYAFYGVNRTTPGYDAVGKLLPEDRILAVDHKPIIAVGDYVDADGVRYHGDKSDSLRGRVKHADSVVMTVLRAGKKLDVTVKPSLAKDKDGKVLLDDVEGTYCWIAVEGELARWGLTRRMATCQGEFKMLGIELKTDVDYVHVGLLRAGWQALRYPVLQTRAIGAGLYGIVFGNEKADPGGPKRIFDEFSKAWKAGWLSGVELLMMLSVYLGLFNLFPLPALDGGRLVFLGYELVTRRRANPKIEAMVHMSGIMVLGVVMILVTLRDCHVF
jgi:regulator of sigma E protease